MKGTAYSSINYFFNLNKIDVSKDGNLSSISKKMANTPQVKTNYLSTQTNQDLKSGKTNYVRIIC